MFIKLYRHTLMHVVRILVELAWSDAQLMETRIELCITKLNSIKFCLLFTIC